MGARRRVCERDSSAPRSWRLTRSSRSLPRPRAKPWTSSVDKVAPEDATPPRARVYGRGCAAGMLVALATASKRKASPGRRRDAAASAPHPRRGARGRGRAWEIVLPRGDRVQWVGRRARQARRAVAELCGDGARAHAHARARPSYLEHPEGAFPFGRLDQLGDVHGGACARPACRRGESATPSSAPSGVQRRRRCT